MEDYTQIIQEINDVIRTNGNKGITGANLNTLLRDIVAVIGSSSVGVFSFDGTGHVITDEQMTELMKPLSIVVNEGDGTLFYKASQQEDDGSVFIRMRSVPLVKENYLGYFTQTMKEALIEKIGGQYFITINDQDQTFNFYDKDGVDDKLSQKQDASKIYQALGFHEFSKDAYYPKGERVVHGGALYEFTADHDAGVWSANDTVATNLADIVSSI